MMPRVLMIAAVAAMLVASAAHAAITLKDDAGNRLAFEQPAGRIVTLAPHLAELVFEAGAGKRLVGTVEWSDFPPAAKRIPRVGDGFRMDIERIVAMQPDLVLAWGGGTPRNTIERMRALKLPVAVLTPERLADIPRHLEWIGRVTANEEAAGRKADVFRAGLQALRERHADQKALRVFYQINDPLLFTIGGRHFITEAIETCGGSNVFADLPSGAHAISREDVIARDPEAIVIGAQAEERHDSANWEPWQDIAAVRAGNVLVVDAELLARAAPRMLEGIAQMCGALNGARARLGAD